MHTEHQGELDLGSATWAVLENVVRYFSLTASVTIRGIPVPACVCVNVWPSNGMQTSALQQTSLNGARAWPVVFW